MKKLYLLAILLAGGIVLNAQEADKNLLGQKVINSTQSTNHTNFDGNDEDETLWAQEVSTAETTYAIVSSYFHAGGHGIFSADDFEVESNVTINSILFNGSQSAEDGGDYINGINIYFYTNEDDAPSGQPLDEGSAFKEVIGIPYDSEFVVVEPGIDAFLGNKIYYIDLEGLNESVELDAGHYWVSIVFDLDLEENDFDLRWSWSDSENASLNAPMLIAPVDNGGLYFPNWVEVGQVGFPVTAFAFTLYGEEEMMSTVSVDLESLKVYPNPAHDFLYIAEGSSQDIQGVNVFNLTGQQQAVNYRNGKMNISHLAVGTYVVQIKTSNGVTTRKFVKK